MKTQHILALLALVIGGIALAQGPLTPPPGYDPNVGPANALNGSGAPQATMKTLHQVEPRTAIAGGTSGVTISASGAYYLAGNITVATGDGITINASNVTLDLNGFSILSSAAPAAGNGVRLGQGLRNVAIRNGNIGSDGAGGAFTGGVNYVVSGFPQPPANVRVADLSVAAAEYGISVGYGYSSVAIHVERCMVIGSSVIGIDGGIVKDCVVEGGPIIGRIVKDCSVSYSSAGGIAAELAENCAVLNSTGIGISTIEARGCAAYGSGGVGIQCSTATDCRAENSIGVGILGDKVSGSVAVGGLIHGIKCHVASDCFSDDNGEFGFVDRAVSVGPNTRSFAATNCVASRNHGGFLAYIGTFTGCSAYENSDVGISSYGHGVIQGCVASMNGRFGIVTESAVVSQCVANSNGLAGIRAYFSAISNCTANANNVLNFVGTPGISGTGSTLSFCVSQSTVGGLNYTPAINDPAATWLNCR